MVWVKSWRYLVPFLYVHSNSLSGCSFSPNLPCRDLRNTTTTFLTYMHRLVGVARYSICIGRRRPLPYSVYSAKLWSNPMIQNRYHHAQLQRLQLCKSNYATKPNAKLTLLTLKVNSKWSKSHTKRWRLPKGSSSTWCYLKHTHRIIVAQCTSFKEAILCSF